MASTKLPAIATSPGSNKMESSYQQSHPGTSKTKDDNQAFFKLTSTGATYRLPNPKDLRPYVDCETGALVSWPAYSTKQPLVKLSASEHDRIETPKPKFLDRLEKFLSKELRALDCTDPSKPSEKRLQAFREVFEYLIDDFKTYRPILSAIKSEYENLIELQKKKIRELEPLQSLIITISEHCEKKLMSLKQDELGEIAAIKAENEKLKNIIIKTRQETAELQEQVKKLQEEISKEYKRYRDENDARKLLVQDLNDLKLQLDETNRASHFKEDESGEGDAVVLRIALKRAREDLETRTKKLSEVMANFGDVVPSKDYERLDAQFKAQEQELEELKQSYQTLMTEHSTLIGVHKKTVQQRDHLGKEYEELKRSATPRPDWDKCAKYMEGGAERWQELSQDRSSNELMDILLAEMTGQALEMIKSGVGVSKEYFQGLLNNFEGDASDIPRFLRCEGEIVNRRIGKRDCAILINDIWKERVSSMQENSNQEFENFDEFIFNFLKKRYGSEPLAYEWGYNLYDACSRYTYEPTIGLFNGIIGGQMDEKLYHDHTKTIESLSQEILQESNAAGLISSEELKAVLRRCFPWKNDEDLYALQSAAKKDNGDSESDIEHKNLFKESEEGLHGEFLRVLQSQDKTERLAYINEIDEKLETESGSVTLEQARQAFLSVDPVMTEAICNAYLQRGFGLPTDKISTNLTIKKNDLLANLRGGSIRRVSERKS